MADFIDDEHMRDTVLACADLAGRAGARHFQIGYLHDDVPVAEAGWYAHAQYRGARVQVDNQPGPAEAAEALARRLLTGAQCRCGRLVALSTAGAVAFDGVTLADGSRWSTADARRAGQCLWRRVGARWEPSCPVPSDRPTRRERRRRG
ncbi:hypothetical protein [Micromonospora carbonacea]|uniref:hypothetical protein n=1 Tax=Micromonospora carbonacea TaxID=47853 RepID=UPI0037227DC9